MKKILLFSILLTSLSTVVNASSEEILEESLSFTDNFFNGISEVVPESLTSLKEQLQNTSKDMREAFKLKYAHDLNISTEAQKARLNAQKWHAHMQSFKKIILTPKSIAAISIAIASTYGVSLLFRHGVQLLFKFKPSVVIETSKNETWWHTFFSKTRPESRLDEMVYSQSTHSHLNHLLETTLQAIARKRPIKNMLFYGPAGTGKSFIAKEIALNSGADYSVINCANFSQMPIDEALTSLKQALAFSKGTKKPVIIILEEVDAIFSNRKHSTALDHKLTNAFISEISKPSDTKRAYFMTTNLLTLDPAILSRIAGSAIVNITEPDLKARATLLANYIKKNLESKFEIEQRLVRELKKVAQTIDGWTGRDIEQLTLDIADIVHLRDDKKIYAADFIALIARITQNRAALSNKVTQ